MYSEFRTVNLYSVYVYGGYKIFTSYTFGKQIYQLKHNALGSAFVLAL
jgi:hypothetical protein